MDGQETFTLGCEDKQVNIHVICLLVLHYKCNKQKSEYLAFSYKIVD